jgi:hypothetical protein
MKEANKQPRWRLIPTWTPRRSHILVYRCGNAAHVAACGTARGDLLLLDHLEPAGGGLAQA